MFDNAENMNNKNNVEERKGKFLIQLIILNNLRPFSLLANDSKELGELLIKLDTEYNNYYIQSIQPIGYALPVKTFLKTLKDKEKPEDLNYGSENDDTD